MALLTERERLELVDDLMTSQDQDQIVFYREDQSGAFNPLPPQTLVRVTAGRGIRIATASGGGVIQQNYLNVYFAGVDLDVQIGDTFDLDGHGGGKVTRVHRDPVLKVDRVDAAVPIGAP